MPGGSVVVLQIGLGLISDSEVFPLGLDSASDWTDPGFLTQTGQDSEPALQ